MSITLSRTVILQSFIRLNNSTEDGLFPSGLRAVIDKMIADGSLIRRDNYISCKKVTVST